MTVGSLRMMPLPARVHERVGRAEVDREVARQDAASTRPADAGAATGARARARAARARTRRCCAPSTTAGGCATARSRCRPRSRATANNRKATSRLLGRSIAATWLDRRIGMLLDAPSRIRPTSAPASRSARISFSVSMQNRAASNAALAMRRRDHDEHRRFRQLRDRRRGAAARRVRGRASGAARRRRSRAIARARPAPRTPRRSSPRRRRGPRRDRARRRRSVTTAPAAGVVAHASSAVDGQRLASVSAIQSRASDRGRTSTATVYGRPPRRRPGRRSRRRRPRSRSRSRVVTLDRDGARGRRGPRGPSATIDDDGHDDDPLDGPTAERPLRRASGPAWTASGCTRAS